jgi:hypothetical protein
MEDIGRRNGISREVATAITDAFQREHPGCTIYQFWPDGGGGISISTECGSWSVTRIHGHWHFGEQVVV